MSGAALDARAAPTTAERILLAGIDEFGRLGFAGASTARIVDAASCNVRMLYHYYGSKDGLYRAALERVYSDLRAAERGLVFDERDSQGSLERFVAFTFDYMLDHPEFPRMMRVENLNGGLVVREIGSVFETARPLMGSLARLMEAGVEQGVFGRRIAPEHLYLDILGLSFVHIIQPSHRGRPSRPRLQSVPVPGRPPTRGDHSGTGGPSRDRIGHRPCFMNEATRRRPLSSP